MLEDQSLPISAKELHEKALDQIHDIDLSTIYRMLDAFEAHQIVQRTILHLPDKDLAVFELRQNRTSSLCRMYQMSEDHIDS
ncbi:MAG: transcriptional repressor [Faecalicoccus sp.]|nr:transcriptional repressor [Faecalicoccus sp.]